MSARSWVLAPRDGFFAKDGRGWFTSASWRTHGLRWPWSTTVRGAVRSAWGRRYEESAARGSAGPLTSDEWLRLTADVRLGASLPLLGGGEGWQLHERLWPVPADAFYSLESEQVERIEPMPPSDRVTVRRFGAGSDSAAKLWRPAVSKGKPAARPLWWTEKEFTDWCAGRSVPRLDADARAARAPRQRTEVRLSIDAGSMTAADGMLFSTEITETDAADGRRWAIAVQVEAPATASLDDAVTFVGGKRRLARFERPVNDPFAMSADRSFDDSPGLALYVITPAHFSQGWLPDGFAVAGEQVEGTLPGVGAVVLRGALVGRPEAVGGWDLHTQRPKPIRRLVPAGSVYYFERVDGRPFTALERDALWLAALPQMHRDDVDDGFGRVVAAPWTPRREVVEESR